MRKLLHDMFSDPDKNKLVFQFYLVWLLMNVIIGLMPIFSDALDGKGFKELFPSILLVFVVLLASSSHMFLKQKDVPLHHKSVKFSLSIVWVILLLMVSSKYPAHQDSWNKYYILNINVISIIAIVFSLISIVLAAINIFPDIEFDIKSTQQQKAIEEAGKSAKDQKLNSFSNVEKM